jgi:hypothetical protein
MLPSVVRIDVCNQRTSITLRHGTSLSPQDHAKQLGAETLPLRRHSAPSHVAGHGLGRHSRARTRSASYRFRLVVFPVITGNTGRERIYDGYPDVALDMIGSKTFDGRIQLLKYVPTILAGHR